jgi:short subunit dehydrogenase-like uncharacterized protein
MSEKQYDVIVFGATSFVGKILCAYLAEQFGFDGAVLKWAAAGRSGPKLEKLRATLGTRAAWLPLVVADAADEDALRSMCAVARVVVSTVGPYALYGEPLVKVCASTGTDYCDLTGEVQWIKRMLDRYEGTAKASGARLVHCCGFDSIPSDMGVYFIQQQAQQRFGTYCSHVKMRVKAMRGGASGGTIASMMNIVKEAAGDAALRKELANPYSLCPAAESPKTRQDKLSRPQYDPDFGVWLAPFVMANINTRIVHRSNALSNYAYGREFRYDEAMIAGQGAKGRITAFAISAGLAIFAGASALPPSRWLLKRIAVPAPGEGPSPEAQKRGFYDMRFIGMTPDGKAIRAKVTGDADPGYGSTSKILGQVCARLALNTGKQEKPGGFWTPATIFGDSLLGPLKAHAGMTFEIL